MPDSDLHDAVRSSGYVKHNVKRMKKISTVLIVDDNKSTLQLNKWLLDDFFPSDSVYAISSAQEAVDFIQKMEKGQGQNPGFPLLIFCDVYMPGMSGWDLVSYIQSTDALEEQIFIVLLSAYAHAEDAGNKCMGKNIVYMNKPLTDENVELIKSSFDLVFE